jgi:hypothetical protein
MGESFSDRYRPYSGWNGPLVDEDVTSLSLLAIGATIRF